MNIFWLDRDLKKAAREHVDKHVVKMLVEYTQLLSSSSRLSGLEQGYKLSHTKHPCTLWLLESVENWILLYTLAEYLYEEYKWRYDEKGRHKSYETLKTLRLPPLPRKQFTEPPQCMPDKYKGDDFVIAYRNYYIGEKDYFANWKYRERPEWFNYNGILIPNGFRIRDREKELRDKYSDI